MIGDASPVRPMTPADYDDGVALRDVRVHPLRDLVLGAVVGAAALWAVPKVLDYVFDGRWLTGDDYEPDDLEEEPA